MSAAAEADAAGAERDQLYDALSRRLTQADAASAWPILGDAGVQGLLIPEALGGLGMTAGEAEPIMAALGGACWPTPFVESSIVAATLLARFATSSSDEVLRSMAESGEIATVAGLEERLRGGVSGSKDGEQWRLDGTLKLVLDADHAKVTLVVVDQAEATGLFLIDPALASGRHSYPTIDGRLAADLQLDRAPATLLTADAGEAVAAAADAARACIAVEAAAIMKRLVRDTVEYARQRRQFGQTLAQFQVVQHRLVDMQMHARRAGAIARRAMQALDEPAEVRGRIVSAAKATVATAGRFVGQQAVQLHGAMGMTDELALSRCFKRLTVIADELGSADQHAARHASLRDAG